MEELIHRLDAINDLIPIAVFQIILRKITIKILFVFFGKNILQFAVLQLLFTDLLLLGRNLCINLGKTDLFYNKVGQTNGKHNNKEHLNPALK